jgi:hypothetical protein
MKRYLPVLVAISLVVVTASSIAAINTLHTSERDLTDDLPLHDQAEATQVDRFLLA